MAVIGILVAGRTAAAGSIVRVIRDNGRIGLLRKWFWGRFRFRGHHRDDYLSGRRLLVSGADLDHDGLPVPLLQILPGRLLLPGLPVGVGAGNCDGHRLPAREVAHIDGPLHQLLRHVLPILAPIVVALDQDPAVRVEPLQLQHPVGAAEGELHIRVDLDAQGAVGNEVGLVITKEHDAQAGGQAGNAGQGLPQGGAFFPGVPQLHDVPHCVPHLIAQVGGLQKAALLVQHHRVGRMHLHDQIAHASSPPLLGPTWHRWPRMIS